MSRSPYDILGVKETDPIEVITSAYNSLVKMLHPDKADNSFIMSRDEQTKAYGEVRAAYKKIREIEKRRTSSYNKHDIEYSIGNDFKINNIMSGANESGSGFNVDKFNKVFEEQLKNIEGSEIEDPNRRGYHEFSARSYSSGPLRNVIPAYNPSISIDENKMRELSSQRAQRSKTELVQKMPDEFEFGTFGSGNSFSNCQELGLLNITDFSTRTTGKGAICGTDLMSAFADTERWEDIASRNAELSAKFTSNENVDVMTEQMRMQRTKPIEKDKELERLLRAKSIVNDISNSTRENVQKMRDDYYNDLNMARLGSGRF